MKKLLIAFISMLYVHVSLVFVACFIGENQVVQYVLSGLFFASAIVACIINVIFIVLCGVKMFNGKSFGISYSYILKSKLALIPFFIFYFLVGIFFFPLIITPLFPVILVGVIVLIGFCYSVLLPTSIASCALTLEIRQKDFAFGKQLFWWQVAEFFFVLDVIAAFVINKKYKNYLVQKSNENNMVNDHITSNV